MAEWAPSLFFWILAAATVASALLVVSFRSILHAALALIVCFFTVAGLYLTLRADFLALVQVLVYIGAIAVLMLFGIMLTRNMAQGNPGNRLSFPAGVLSGVTLFAILWIVIGLASFPQVEPGFALTGIVPIAEALFAQWVLPFVVAGVLLLAATIGAIVIIKED